MKFAYTGYDAAGKPVTSVVEAADRDAAAETLKRRGVFVSEIGPPRDATRLNAGATSRPSLRRLDQVSGFLRQLSVLVSTGTPLVEALASLESQQREGPFRAVLRNIRARLEEGVQLSEAMTHHPGYFDGVCRSLVAAGESGGKLDAMLTRLAAFTRQQVRVRKTITGAMVYPCLLIAVAFAVTFAMLGFVLPRFEGLFKSLDTPLPPTTQVLMDLSAFARQYWFAVVGLLVAIPVLVRVYVRTARGRDMVENLMLRLPHLGHLTRGYATARMSRVLGVLLDGKVTLLEAIRLTRQATGLRRFESMLARAEDHVTRGESFSAAINIPALIPPNFVEAVRSGERSGKVSNVLLTLADAMDEDNDLALKTVTGLLEPLILIVLGLVVGGMAISMFLPLFDLTAAGGRH
ncbi:MAG: type II secretion system protein F [Phycisphaerae bacterium]|nr:MAG: type II secretion system protein F [Phycisphaerae bacterium]